jgi:pyruvate dehydrogenase E1 component beta subunit
MPSTPADARDLLIAAVLCNDPVLYIDDRWLYQEEARLKPPVELALSRQGPLVVRTGRDVTLAACGYSTHLCRQAADQLAQEGIEGEVVDLRVLNPLDTGPILASVQRTGRLLAVDGDWSSCGLAAEVLARAVEHLEPAEWKARPVRITLPDAPAPTSQALERLYYTRPEQVCQAVRALVSQDYHEAHARSHRRGLRSGS